MIFGITPFPLPLGKGCLQHYHIVLDLWFFEIYIWLIKRCIWCGATTGTRSSWTESFPSLLLSTSTAGFHFLLSSKVLETLFTFDRGVFISIFLNIDAGWIRKVRISTIVRSDVVTWYEADWILDLGISISKFASTLL